MSGPCTWPVSYAGCSSCTPLEALSVQEKAAVEAMAVTYLWEWTLRQFDVCTMTVRPCRRECRGLSTFWGKGPFPRTWAYAPALVEGQWYGASCGTCRTAECSCAEPVTLRLPGPVVSVGEILMDGVVLAPVAYRLDAGGLLVRLDGSSWPDCQDLTRATTEPGTWQVTFDRGTPVPEGGQLAAGVLACELAKALCRDSTCALPQRIQTITRQGVTVAVTDPFTGVDKGATGIWLIDSWIASVTKPRRQSTVHSVDLARPRNRLGTV